MKRLALAFALLLAVRSEATVHCSGTPCADSTGGAGFSSPVTTDPVNASGKWSWPAADAANAVQLGETAGCMTMEGPTADAFETRLCGIETAKDGQLNFATNAAQGVEISTLFNGGVYDPISISPGTYTVALFNGPNFFKLRSNAYGCWTNGISSDPCDAGIIRNTLNGGLTIASGTDGTAIGYLSSSQLVQAKPAPYTTTATESGGLYTNTGDADGTTITLLNDPTVGVSYDIAVTVAQTITIQASAGETLYSGATTCTTLASSTVGSIAHTVATVGGSGGSWMTQVSGTWVCTP